MYDIAFLFITQSLFSGYFKIKYGVDNVIILFPKPHFLNLWLTNNITKYVKLIPKEIWLVFKLICFEMII